MALHSYGTRSPLQVIIFLLYMTYLVLKFETKEFKPLYIYDGVALLYSLHGFYRLY